MEIERTNIQNFIAISDIISLLNMSSGFLSIICSINHNFELSAILMIIAIIFDSIDGWVARKANRDDSLGFGKNIDSLNTASIPLQLIAILVSLLIVICGVLRLTRYNVIADHIKTSGFIGFPIPGISFIIATLYLSGLYNNYLALLLATIVSILMISNVKYPKFSNMPAIIISCILIVLIILPIPTTAYGVNIPALILLLFCLYYLIINLIKK